MLAAELFAKGFWSQPFQAGDHCFRWNAGGYPPQFPEGTQVHKPQFPGSALGVYPMETHPGVGTGGPFSRRQPLELAGHAQVGPQFAAGAAVAGEATDQIFAAAPPGAQGTAA